MPLVLMCGPPCSGKSTRVSQLVAYMSKEYSDTQVLVIEDSAMSTVNGRNILYASESAEKESRGRLRSEVQKTLTKDTVVVLDAPNYIKGFRYELYCLSKGCKTTHCVVHCDIGIDTAWSWNIGRIAGEDHRYERPIFDALFARFEAPDARNRWDSPLFVVTADDEVSSFAARVHGSLVGRKPPPPNQSTQCQPLATTNFLYDIDRTTQEVVASILQAQKDVGPGLFDVVLTSSDTTLRLTGHPYTPMELARLRRQFIVYIKMRPVEDGRKLASMFVQYLNGGQLTGP